MPPPGLNSGFAAANARGRGGLQETSGAVDSRLAAGRQTGKVDLSGLELAGVPPQVWAIIDAVP